MFGLIKKTTLLFNALFSEVFEKAVDPIVLARQRIREIDEKIEQTERHSTSVFQANRSFENKKATAEDKVEEFAEYATIAVKNGDDDLARSCLSRQLNYQAEVDSYTKALEDYKPIVEGVKAQLKNLRETRDSAARELSFLDARLHASKANVSAAKIMQEAKGHNLSGELAKVRDAVEQAEAFAGATIEVYETEESRISNKITEMNKDQREKNIDVLLDKMKKDNSSETS